MNLTNRIALCVVGAALSTGLFGCSSASSPEPSASEPSPSNSEPSAANPEPSLSQKSGLSAASSHSANIAAATPLARVAGRTFVGLDDADEAARVRGVVLPIARAAGVLSPAKVHAVVATDHQAAEFALSGALVTDHDPVYVVKMTGGPFTALQHPKGVDSPKGNVMTITLDAVTHRVTDVGYVDEEPDLAKIDSHVVDIGAL